MSSTSSSSSSSDSSSDSETELKNLKIEKDNEINIVLLGETGVGKSTFINALGNYLSLKYFSNAEDKGLVKIIPTVYQINDKNGKSQTVKIVPKMDENEEIKLGESATQNVKSYVFPISQGREKVRLIDTPGMGDTRGVEQDEINGANIINYLKTLEKVHAICILCKPTQVRKTVYFEYCVYQVLSLLEKSAVKNMCFLFSHTRGSYYGPGDTLEVLRKIINDFEESTGVKIPLNENKNVFCFDNEAFRYLGALEKNVQLDSSSRELYRKSWMESARECWKFISYLRKEITPYVPTKLFHLHIARKTMVHFSEVLTEVTKIKQDNEILLKRIEENKTLELQSISQLKNEKNVVKDVFKTKVSKPVLVCTSKPSCAVIYKIEGQDKCHYKICHTCYEIDDCNMFVAGCPEIAKCDVIDKSTMRCKQCGCDFLMHMHLDYITVVYERPATDDHILQCIAISESLLDTYAETTDAIKLKNVELIDEYKIIKAFCKNIARFIGKNAIISFSESYKSYITYLINQQRSTASSSVSTSVDELQKYFKQYEEIEDTYKDAMHNASTSKEDFNFDMGDDKFECLFNALKLNGQNLKIKYQSQKMSILNLNTAKEYIHETFFTEEQKNKRKNKDTNRNLRAANRDNASSHTRETSEQRNRLDSRNSNRDNASSHKREKYEQRNRLDSRNSNYQRSSETDSRNSTRDYQSTFNYRCFTPSNIKDRGGDYHQQHQGHFNYYDQQNYQSREPPFGAPSYFYDQLRGAYDPRSGNSGAQHLPFSHAQQEFHYGDDGCNRYPHNPGTNKNLKAANRDNASSHKREKSEQRNRLDSRNSNYQRSSRPDSRNSTRDYQSTFNSRCFTQSNFSDRGGDYHQQHQGQHFNYNDTNTNIKAANRGNASSGSSSNRREKSEQRNRLDSRNSNHQRSARPDLRRNSTCEYRTSDSSPSNLSDRGSGYQQQHQGQHSNYKGHSSRQQDCTMDHRRENRKEGNLNPNQNSNQRQFNKNSSRNDNRSREQSRDGKRKGGRQFSRNREN